MGEKRKMAAVWALACATAAGPAAAQGPIWGKQWTGGQTFPLPFGVGLTLYEQRQDYAVDRLSVGIPGFEGIPTDALAIDNRLRELNLKLDAWLLPFLNVFLIGGTLDGRTVVDFGDLDLPIPLGRVPIDYDGEVYGGGAVLAWGTERAFATLTPVWTQTSLSGDFDSTAEAFVVAPRFGVHDARGAVWVGAMYQRAEESHSGTISLPFVGPVPFAVELVEDEEWNGLLGASLALDTHWNLELEGGFGGRESATATVSYRF